MPRDLDTIPFCRLYGATSIRPPTDVSPKENFLDDGSLERCVPGGYPRGPGSGHIGQELIVQGTDRPRTFVPGPIAVSDTVLSLHGLYEQKEPVLHNNMRRKTSMKVRREKTDFSST